MSELMSQTVARKPLPAALAARNAMSPVPPATSSSANGVSARGGLSALIIRFFQTRCRPADIRSFIRS
jgi:hypothetical protein